MGLLAMILLLMCSTCGSLIKPVQESNTALPEKHTHCVHVYICTRVHVLLEMYGDIYMSIQNYLLEGGPRVVQASLGECSRNPSVSVYKLVLL